MSVDDAVGEVIRDAEAHPDALVCIVGPTASGKTELAVRLCERVGGEIVSCDSVQVYRHFDCGSGKPTLSEKARAPHHLVDIVDPTDAMDAAEYSRLAELAIADIRARGRVPVVCGGTFLWLRAFAHGLAEGLLRDPAIRTRHAEVAAGDGRAALHQQLASVDPVTAARLHPNDFVRVSRALEVFELTGKGLYEWHNEHGFSAERHHVRLFAIEWPEAIRDERIRRRIGEMLRAGWRDEVSDLLAKGFGAARAMGSVGYAEVRAAIEGTLSESELDDRIFYATRQFARKQRKWLKHASVTWLRPSPG